MLRAHSTLHGYGDMGVLERDYVQCNHCNAHVPTKPGTASTVYLIHHRDGRTTEEPGAFCRVCMSPVCLTCHAKGTCTPFEKQLELWEARDRLRRAVEAG